MSNNQPIDYFALKKGLAPYIAFSFKAPSRGKDFTTQQKSAITRAYNKIGSYLDENYKVKTNEVTFLKYPEKSKLPNIDGIRTQKGLFYKFRDAKLKRLKGSKKWVIVVNPKIIDKQTKKLTQKRRDIFFPIPKKYMTSIDNIKRYVDALKEKYGPHDIMWSYAGKRERTQYDPELFDLYFSTLSGVSETSEEFEDLTHLEKITVYKVKKFRKKYEDEPDYYNGVFFIYYL